MKAATRWTCCRCSLQRPYANYQTSVIAYLTAWRKCICCVFLIIIACSFVVDLFTLFNSETNSFCTHSFVTVLSSRYTVKTSANLLLETVAWTVTQIQVTLDHAFSTLYAFHEWNEERRKFINIQFVKCIKKWRWTWRNACRKIFFMSLKFKWRESSSKSWNLHAAKSKMLRVLLY